MSGPTHITIEGASEHNLRHVDLRIPRDALVVFTGVSGSGKSSLAHDTIYKEGQRRFMASLSAYARQFLGQMERPRVDRVEGVSPTLSIDQKTVNRNPRSTVGTITELYDHLRLLLARLGTPHCPRCGREVSKLGVEHVVDAILQQAEGGRVQVLGPIVRERKGAYRKELEALRRDGWVRARVDGALRLLEDDIALARYEKHTIEVVVDRLRAQPSERGRLIEAVETAVRLGDGVVVVLSESSEQTYATARACPDHPEVAIPELEPRLFSFNAPQGACPGCEGLGALERFVPERIVDLSLPVPDCFVAFNDQGKLPFAHFTRDTLLRVVELLGGDLALPVADWGPDLRRRLLHGDEALRYVITLDRHGRQEQRERSWKGLLPMVDTIWKYTGYRGLRRFRERLPCPDCGGLRLHPVALAVRWRGHNIAELAAMTVAEAHALFSSVRLHAHEREVGALLLQELRDRLSFLHEVGLDYLSLDRPAATLSGGEAQRIRLAAQVGSALQGVTYVLDEPSIGLHPRDNRQLLQALRRLRDRGNTVIVVEHDAETILAADHVVDVGPGAGRDGGEVVVSGSPAKLMRCQRSITGQYLSRQRVIAMPAQRRQGQGQLRLRGASAHNLDGVDVNLPLATLTVLTGVSGSGKSTLLFEVLEASVRAGAPVACEAIDGLEQVDKLIRISQQPIGRTPRSNPATYTKAFDPIRALFAATQEARARGYKKGRFSFNVAGGRCEVCEGAGVRMIEMQFLPSVAVTCEECAGTRYNAETLEVHYKGRTIAEVLAMTVAEAVDFFAPVPKLARILRTLDQVGLGYVCLGQPSTTLSGGEAQRVKLATELHRPPSGHTLYLLDEPTTGLHFLDVQRLLDALQALVDGGNTVVVIEHHTDVIKCADHLIDLGPEGGVGGGKVVGVGTPEQIAALDTPTGRALAELPELRALPLAAEPTPHRLRRARRVHPALRVFGARAHNLQNIDVSVPHGQLTVVTGVSGSGKTSLAFDTLFSEGQRQYVESLSTYARRFLGRLERAPVDRVEGLAPAIAIDQRSRSHNPRSTVATVTEIHDVLRLLYARVGLRHCPRCGVEVRPWSPTEVATALRASASGAGWLHVPLRPTEAAEARQAALLRQGWSRLLQQGVELSLSEPAALAALAAGTDLVLDRLHPGRTPRARLAEAVATGFSLGNELGFSPRAGGDTRWFSPTPTCHEHGPLKVAELEPRHFSFNSRLGACSRCGGLGVSRVADFEAIFPRPKEGLWDALDLKVAGVLGRSGRSRALLDALLQTFGVTPTTPVASWPSALREAALRGHHQVFDIQWRGEWGSSVRQVTEQRAWTGLEALVLGWASGERYARTTSCPDCGGGRLQPELLAVRLGGQSIHQLCELTVADARDQISGWALEGERAQIAARALQELRARLGFLVDVGLGYLALDRAAHTLSGGEAQRIRLASQLGSRLTGVVYVLDEPTVGLHPRDTGRLLDTLEGLRDLGNTVLVVEHDLDTLLRADHVIELGPGAGSEGGRLIASGPPSSLVDQPASRTGDWLAGRVRLPPRPTPRPARAWLRLRGASGHNLQQLDVDLPTGVWVGVTGVSGSGKSSLILGTLVPALRDLPGLPYRELHRGEPVDKLVVVNQAPIGRSPRSTPATFTGVMDKLRALFAQTLGAQQRGWKPGRFSFNSPRGGRCQICEGRGATLVEMHFLPDVWVRCQACRGRRYGRETLEVRWKGHSIADVLAMRAEEASTLFEHHRALRRPLQALVDVGLGYLSLGQPASTLSGGEAQRVKLAAELSSRKGHALYLLDEPTTGLHLADVAHLVAVLQRLVDQGHTVLTIEHHLPLLRQVDWILDLGPEGGEAGGRLVGAGTPEQIAALETATGRALRGAPA